MQKAGYWSFAGVVTLLAVCAGGCSLVSTQPASAPPTASEDRTVQVTRSTVTPVVTLDAQVASSVTYEITAPVDGKLIHGPEGATVTDHSGVAHTLAKRELDTEFTYLVPNGAAVSRGLPIAKSTFAGFVIASTVQGSDLLRMKDSPESARAQIAGGAEPFVCDLLDKVPSAFGEPSARRLYCIIPPSQPVIGGLTGVLAVRFPAVRNAMVLPLEAVGGSVSSGSVRISEAGVTSERSVELGPSDGTQIVIAEGLHEGDVVLLPSPSLIHD